MKIGRYIADKMYAFIIGGLSYLVILLMMFGFKVDKSLIIAVSIVMFISGILVLIIDIARKKKFYDELVSNTEGLDKKYLVLETIKKPHFYLLCKTIVISLYAHLHLLKLLSTFTYFHNSNI